MFETAAAIARIKQSIHRITGGTREVTILAATKTVAPDRILPLRALGIHDIGENRVQELLEKTEQLKDFRQHFIGTLQRNKVKYIVDKVCLIHSCDNLKLAEEIDRQAKRMPKIMDILIEVNAGDEQNKSGVKQDEVFAFAEAIGSLPNIRLCGLMGVFPVGAQERLYADVSALYQTLQKKLGPQIQYLSMGMSDDYETALVHHANIIRLGTAIFGQRETALQ